MADAALDLAAVGKADAHPRGPRLRELVVEAGVAHADHAVEKTLERGLLERGGGELLG
jgi:hypothetical protein